MTTQAVSTQSEPTTAYRETNGSHPHGLLATIAKDILVLNDWLSGPPMTAQDRSNRALAETQGIREVGPYLP